MSLPVSHFITGIQINSLTFGDTNEQQADTDAVSL